MNDQQLWMMILFLAVSNTIIFYFYAMESKTNEKVLEARTKGYRIVVIDSEGKVVEEI